MKVPFLKPLHQASQPNKSDLLDKPFNIAVTLLMSALAFWAIWNPIDFSKSTSMTHGAQIFEEFARNPNLYVRLPIDLLIGIAFGSVGIYRLMRFVKKLIRKMLV